MSETHNYEGVVQGGPLDGRHITNNASKGFVLVDLNNQLAWVHDFDKKLFGADVFKAREGEPLSLIKLEIAQEDGGRAVIVLDGEDSDGGTVT